MKSQYLNKTSNKTFANCKINKINTISLYRFANLSLDHSNRGCFAGCSCVLFIVI